MTPKLRTALPMLIEIIIPIVGYFLLHTAGFNDFWALMIPGIVTAVVALTNTVRRGWLDTIGTLVVAEIALSVALFFLTRDPHIVLLKPSFYTGLAGLYLLYTCQVGRPFIFQVSKPFATRGDPARERAYERAWTHSAGFRREQRLITAVWGLLWLAESAVRVVLVLHLSISQAVFIGQLPAIVAIVTGIVFTRLRVPALRQYVAQHSQSPSPAEVHGG